MKASLKLIVSILALGFAGASLAQAADEAPKSDQPAKGPRPERGEMRGNAQNRVKEISEQLGLTEDQKTKVADILKASAGDFKAARGDREKMVELMKAQREQIRAVLTPEQQTKFDSMKQEGRRAGGKPNGKRGDKPAKEDKTE
jgi:periplasmic protein CpxP/Spy